MYPSIAHVMAQTHAENLRREADERRKAAQVGDTSRPLGTAWQSAVSFVVARARLLGQATSSTTAAQPACCPA